MGRGFTAYCYGESNRKEIVLWSAYYHYRVPDQSFLSVLQRPAYCATCRRFVIAEDIRSTDSMTEDIRRLRSNDADSLYWQFMSGSGPIEHRMAELERRIAWRRTRVSPPRCLECGNAEIMAIADDCDFVHPATGEPIVTESIGWASTSICVAEFSPEGECLMRSSNRPPSPCRTMLHLESRQLLWLVVIVGCSQPTTREAPMFADLAAAQDRVVKALAEAVPEPWERIVVSFERSFEELDDHNMIAFYIIKNEAGYDERDIFLTGAIHESFFALNDAVARQKGQRWGSCEVVLDASGKYEIQYSYDPPKRINLVHDYDSYHKYNDYVKRYAESQEK